MYSVRCRCKAINFVSFIKCSDNFLPSSLAYSCLNNKLAFCRYTFSGCLTQEKIVASCAKKFVVIADSG